MSSQQRYELVRLDALDAVECPCGTSKRAFAGGADRTVSVHQVHIAKTSRPHFHKTLTEVYYVLEGRGHVELDGERVDVQAGDAVQIRPLCRHRAVGELTILNIVVPAFDPEDEWFD